MIPKIIHYCWFGKGEKSDLAKKCLESWKQYLPDYKIIEWNETNFDINEVPYVKSAYERKKYAFVSDFVRLSALQKYGGIYFDLDVEVKKNIDIFLKYDGVFSFESFDRVATAVMMSKKENPIISSWMNSYYDREFVLDGREDLTTNVHEITKILSQNGFKITGETQIKNNIALYNKEIFCPFGAGDNPRKRYLQSYTVHWCEGTWFESGMKRKIKFITIVKKIIGTNNYYRLLRIIKKRKNTK